MNFKKSLKNWVTLKMMFTYDVATYQKFLIYSDERVLEIVFVVIDVC